MEEKYWFGIAFCYPDGNFTELGKFAIKVAMTLSGAPAASLVSEGLVKIYKPLFGGLPVECVLIITDDYIEFKPSKLATYFADGVEAYRIPKGEIIDVDKSFNFIIMQHVLKVKLRTTEVKFFVNVYSISVKEIVSNIKKLI